VQLLPQKLLKKNAISSTRHQRCRRLCAICVWLVNSYGDDDVTPVIG